MTGIADARWARSIARTTHQGAPITIDLRATKAIRFTDAHRVEMFLEAFNVTNHVNYSGLNTNMNTAAFLIRTSARPARQIQWGLRYSF